MTTSRSLVLALAVTVVTTSLLAAGPDAGRGEIKISMGKTVYVSLSAPTGAKVAPQILDAKPKNEPFISFSLSAAGGLVPRSDPPTASPSMTIALEVSNTYDKSLSYKARMCTAKRRRCVNMPVQPVAAGDGFVHAFSVDPDVGSDPIDTIVVSALVLK